MAVLVIQRMEDNQGSRGLLFGGRWYSADG